MPTARRGGVFTARCSFSLLYCALQKPYDGLAVVFFHLPVVLVVHVLSAWERRRSCPHCQECFPLLLRKVFLRCPFQKGVRPVIIHLLRLCSLPSMWPLLRTRITVTDHKLPIPLWKMPNMQRNSIVGLWPTLLGVTKAHSESRRGSRTSFKYPPSPPNPIFFRALKTAFMQLLIFSCLSI